MDTSTPVLPRSRLSTLEAPLLRARAALGERAMSAASIQSAGLDIDEIYASMKLAGTALSRPDVEALLRRGVAVGGHKIDDYIAVEDYASAARYVQAAFMPNRRHGFVSIEEIVGLHTRIARRTAPRPGNLRETSLRPFPSGMIPPPAWMIPQALAAYVERFRPGPAAGTSALEWIAQAHARFERIHPFENANGRVGRSLVNLLLRRAGFLPCVLRANDTSAYFEALRAADSRNISPFAILLAKSLARSYALVASIRSEATGVRPLSEFAVGKERATLYKAAQRGRLRAFRRDGRLYTAPEWIEDYKALK